jgi:hypothetical protein
MTWRYFIAAILLATQVFAIVSLFTSYVHAEERSQQQIAAPVTLIPAITQNILTIVSLLIGTSSFKAENSKTSKINSFNSQHIIIFSGN